MCMFSFPPFDLLVLVLLLFRGGFRGDSVELLEFPFSADIFNFHRECAKIGNYHVTTTSLPKANPFSRNLKSDPALPLLFPFILDEKYSKTSPRINISASVIIIRWKMCNILCLQWFPIIEPYDLVFKPRWSNSISTQDIIQISLLRKLRHNWIKMWPRFCKVTSSRFDFMT